MLAAAVWIVSTATSSGAQVPLPPINVTGQVQSVERRPCCGDTGTWSLSARRAVLDSLAAGRKRWEANRPASYRISAAILCGFCGDGSDPSRPPGVYPVVRIRGNEIFATGTFHPDERINGGIWLNVPVDSLFRVLERTANDTSRKITELKLDSLLGFPRAWATDGVHNGENGVHITDQNDWGRVVFFAADQAPTTCSWLHRILGSCAPPYPPLDNEIRTRIGVDRMARPVGDRSLPLFPGELQGAGVDGVVRLQYAVDSAGHVMPYSVNTIKSTQWQFSFAVDDVIDHWAFIPARAEGRPVASFYEEVFDFRAPRWTHERGSLDEQFTALTSIVNDVPSITHDTTSDGVPRTVIGFRSHGENPSAKLSGSELLAAQRAALWTLANFGEYEARDAATFEVKSVTFCVTMLRDTVATQPDSTTLRFITRPGHGAVAAADCPHDVNARVPRVDSATQRSDSVAAETLNPYSLDVLREAGWNRDEVLFWISMKHDGATRGSVCMARRRGSGWDATCTTKPAVAH